MQTLKKRAQQIVHADPKLSDMVDESAIKRCATCLRLWPSSAFIEEDGVEKCPECVDVRTRSYVARVTAEETNYAASRTLKPQISRMPLKSVFPPTIVSMEDGNGAKVSQVAPLRLHRNVAATLVLKGRGFTSADTLSYSSGITDSIAPVTTATQKTLSLVASLGMTPGDHYGLTLNGIDFRNCISVR